MNSFQKLWWDQARSDHEAFLLLRGSGIAPCHSLHYLQMVTEKLAKAYFWRSQNAPPRTHVGFVHFLRLLSSVQPKNRDRIAKLFMFKRFPDFQSWIKYALPIAYELEQIAPALANNGPNPEYPWPHEQPAFAPVTYHFPIWATLTTGRGRELMQVIKIAVDRFAEYADI